MSKGRKLVYASQDAYTNIKVNSVTTFLSALTVGFSLAIFALFIILFMNLNTAVEGLGDRTHVVVYAKDDAGGGIEEMLAELIEVTGVKGVEYISPESALKGLREELSEHEAIFEGVRADIFPRSFDIKMNKAARRSMNIEQAAQDIKNISWVSEVQYGHEWAEKFASFLGFVKLAAYVVGAFLSAAALFIISNTIRLTIYSRRDDIRVMRLLGASAPYIRTPFILEGLLMGFFGGIIAVVMLALGRYGIAAKIPVYLSFITENPFGLPTLVLALVFAGMVLGVLGSFFSLGRFLKA